jgi:hypothetical protein
MNASHGDLDFRFPRLPIPLVWEALVDTAEPTGIATDNRLWMLGQTYRLRAHSFALFINRAPEPGPLPDREETIATMECSGPKDGEDAPPS